MWTKDIHHMHQRFGVYDWIDNSTPAQRKALLELHMRMLTEEHDETIEAYNNSDPEELIDGLIDLCVIAIGTLDMAGVTADEAWQRVMWANMQKQVGVKPERPNPLGLPDLIKPEGWQGPNHKGNYGILEEFL